jgi:hypothetical protein
MAALGENVFNQRILRWTSMLTLTEGGAAPPLFS